MISMHRTLYDITTFYNHGVDHSLREDEALPPAGKERIPRETTHLFSGEKRTS